MNILERISILAALLLTVTIGAVCSLHFHWLTLHQLSFLFIMPGLVGLNTINFLWPATGAVTPTAAQVANQDTVNVDITTDGALTTQTITHNLGISAADLALGYPNVIIEPETATAFDTLNVFMNPATPAKTTNAVIFTFAAVVGRFLAKIQRPHTIGR